MINRWTLKLWINNLTIQIPSLNYNNIFFFRESFNLWHPLLMITLYHRTKIPISFWCRRGLNPRSLIQPSETLLVELTGTHKNYNNTYIEDSKYWNILLLPFSLFNQNQSFKDNSNSIKPNTYIHMNVENSKSKNNNLKKPLSIFIFFLDLFVL